MEMDEEIYEVRWHGRGGQGVVTSSELLAIAALREGKYVYNAPEFGPERRGAPVRAYTRISKQPIELHSGIYNPDAVVVIDPSLQGEVSYITQGLKRGGLIVLNTTEPNENILKVARELNAAIWYVDAYSIAMEIFGRPFYNTPMLGAFVRASGIVRLDTVLSVVTERFGKEPKLAEGNLNAIKRAFETVKKYEW
ncbi:2-oxoacid:acceptor oxidoreductase family protein [Infirmifilum lucidum]|nr:2-oxoacid:acceptor oxidoreductase family protein [Infirmifilum lucidum]